MYSMDAGRAKSAPGLPALGIVPYVLLETILAQRTLNAYAQGRRGKWWDHTFANGEVRRWFQSCSLSTWAPMAGLFKNADS